MSTTKLAEALRLMIDALRVGDDEGLIEHSEDFQFARAALASYEAQAEAKPAPAVEPFADIEVAANGQTVFGFLRPVELPPGRHALWLAAPAAPALTKPLTDEQKDNLIVAHFPTQRREVLALIGAVEKFYGIAASKGEQA